MLSLWWSWDGEGVTVKCGEVEENLKERIDDVQLTNVT